MSSHTFNNSEITKVMAKNIIDSHRGVSPLMENSLDPTMLEKMLYLLSGDTERMRKIHEIAENTALFCEIILLPESHYSNRFRAQQIDEARKAISRYKHIILVTTGL